MSTKLIFLIMLGGLVACESKKAILTAPPAAPLVIKPAQMEVLVTVDERYQSFNVEMLEVTGGKFWKPYGPELETILKEPLKMKTDGEGTPVGMNPKLYEYRPPINLKNPRLLKLAKALAPSYMRVSGTWANTTYFPAEGEKLTRIPKGFQGILTRKQWKSVIDFSQATDARIITSLATSMGTRDEDGIWTTTQARRVFDFTKSQGGHIAAIEYMNEPNIAVMGGAPSDYSAKDFGVDFKIFVDFMKKNSFDTIILGPGSVGESTGHKGIVFSDVAPLIPTEDLLKEMGPGIEAFSYHHYGALSKRCSAMGNQTSPEKALSEEWLRKTDQTLAFYKKLRNNYAPRVPLWNTETADAACGGNPWAGTFLDSFRYLDQLGRLALQGVKVHAHNTLVASDYGLLEEKDFSPKPSYWTALLWRKFMGSAVLKTGMKIKPGLHVYAHCMYKRPGGVAMLVINNDKTQTSKLNLAEEGESYTLTSDGLTSKQIKLNGKILKLGKNDQIPLMTGIPIKAGEREFAPATMTFLTFPEAGNTGCP